MKLQSKILMLVVPLVVLPLVWLGWIAYVKLGEVSRQTSLEQMNTVLDQVGRNVVSNLGVTKANINLFAASSLLKKYVLTEDESVRYSLLQSPLMRLFASYQHAYPEYYELRILLPDGYEDTRSVLTRVPNKTEFEAEAIFFQHLHESDDELHDMYTLNVDNGEPVLYVGRKLILRDDSQDPLATPAVLRGYLVISASLDFLQQQLETQRIGNSGYLFVTDDAGQPLILPSGMSVGGFEQQEFAHILASTIENNVLKTRFNGDDVYLKGRQLHHDLNLFAVLPESDLHAASRELGTLVTGITLLTIILASLLVFYAINHILIHPIKKLVKMAHDIGHSRFDMRSGITSNDEIGELAHSLEAMSRNLQQTTEQVSYLAYRDALTGMPNRRMFKEYLKRALAHAHRYHTELALLFLDLDHFKQVNDTLGHHAGDMLLQQLSERLTECLRDEDEVSLQKSDDPDAAPQDTIARLGGDEFLILLSDIRSPSDCANVSERLLKMLAKPFVINEFEFFITSSIGISVFPADGRNVETLIKNADIAMYHAKEQGRNNYQYFNESMNRTAVERMNMENALRKAIQNQELMLYYQPKVDLHSGGIQGVEALLRWQHPELGMVPPKKFISLAEDSGLIVAIGAWVINEATQQVRRWQDEGIELNMSINISSVQLHRQNMATIIKGYIEQNKCRADRLEIELTETSMVDAYENATSSLNDIRSLGVKISMDDFGTGYSSFSYLRNLPVNILKIDRSFVRDITTDHEDAAIVSAILAMAHTLNLVVVAEGVETIEQLEFLRSHNCDIVQGYLFSRPLPEPELRRFISNHKLLDQLDMELSPHKKSGKHSQLELIRNKKSSD